MKKPRPIRKVSPTAFPIVVTGDVVVDHHLYEGERATAAAYSERGVKVVREHGGAAGLHGLLLALIEAAQAPRKKAAEDAQSAVEKAAEQVDDAKRKPPGRVSLEKAQADLRAAQEKLASIKPVPEDNATAAFGLDLPELHSQPCGHHALATWKPFPKDPSDAKGKDKVWRAGLLMGYGHDEHSPTNSGTGHCPMYAPKPLESRDSGRLLILDDAGFIFRHKAQAGCWLLPKKNAAQPDWVLLKMNGPVCQGDLWPTLAKDFGDRLICVVSANDLRKECVSMSNGLSWERTVEDLHHALHASPVLQSLKTVPRHLIVTFSADGALWLDNTNRNQPQAMLIFDARGAEGEWAQPFAGEAFGYLSCMVAAITRAVIHNPAGPRLAPAVATGLGAMRDLRALGHGLVSQDFPDGFPKNRLAESILKGSGDFSFSPVPWTAKQRAPYTSGAARRVWRIVEMSQCPFSSATAPSLLGLARQVVLQGPSAIKRLPHASFGALLTADRLEIETLRSIRRLMLDYREARNVKKPLSLGVFGPPGAGKSFGVKQIANGVFGEKAWLEFNLSQFSGASDLIGAFHQVRDLVLSGVTPVVFCDEFDSKEYDWLQYLLAPMQDGRFQEGQLNHAIGKCVFIFAGGTSHTFEEFGPPPSDAKAFGTFRLRKGPDFHSRLDAFYNVLGPNQRTLPPRKSGKQPTQRLADASDVCTPLRRALLIRALLNVPGDARLDFDPELLDALLRVPRYQHGARSLEKIVAALQPSASGRAIRRSALPPVAQLAMHVAGDDKHPELAFDALLNANTSFRMSQAIERIAEVIHESWRVYAAKTNALNRPWSELTTAEQEDNRAAARRIPEVLAVAGMAIVPASGRGRAGADVSEQLEHHLERLAEAEHDGWMDQRARNGWIYDPARDDAKKKHPLLIPYAKLPELEKNKDRNSVCDYSKHLAKAGYKIVFI